MTSAVTLPSSPTTPQQAPPLASKPYLDRCVEDLSPSKVAQFEKTANWWSNIATIGTVAFFALAIGAFIATSILFPAYTPIAGIGALILAMPAASKSKELYDWSKVAHGQACKYRAIQNNYSNLTRQTPDQLQQLLMEKGIIWYQIPGIDIQHPENLTRLTPLLARAQYLEKQTQFWMELRDEKINGTRLFTQTTEEDKTRKARLHHLALCCEDAAMDFKMKSAFVNAVLRKPDFKGTIENLGILSKSDYPSRMVGDALNDPTANQMLSFNNHNIAPLTFNDVKTLPVAALGQRIFTAMAA